MRKFIFTLAVLGMFAHVGWAAVYEGIIAETSNGGQLIKVTQVDDLTKDKKTLFVSLDAKTQITGADSAAALKPGDAVSIIASEVGSDHLSAASISIIKV